MVAMFAYDPGLLVLGGGISRAFPLFEAGMRERLRRYPYQHALARTTIAPSEVENISVLGAAALYLDARRGAAPPQPARPQGDPE